MLLLLLLLDVVVVVVIIVAALVVAVSVMAGSSSLTNNSPTFKRSSERLLPYSNAHSPNIAPSPFGSLSFSLGHLLLVSEVGSSLLLQPFAPPRVTVVH